MLGSVRRLVRFLMSIKFGVVLMIFLMVVMMFATQFEVSTSTRAMKRYIYGSLWFDFGVFLFVVNIVVNTVRRRPYKLRHIGFLTVHTGVLVIVAGGLTSRYFGVDGTMPIPEGQASREILLPQNDLVITTAGGTVRHEVDYDLRPEKALHDDLYDVPGTPYFIQVDRFFATGMVADTLRNDAKEENPVLRVTLGTATGSPVNGLLATRDPDHASLTAGGVTLRFVEADAVAGLRAEWSRGEIVSPEEEDLAGHLHLFWTDGRTETLHVPRDGGRLPTSREGIDVEVVQVFRSFMLTAEGSADAVGKPDNPAIRFRIHAPHGTEEHFSFTAFPDFRAEPPEDEEWVLGHAEWEPGAAFLRDGGEALEVVVAREGPGRFATHTSWADPLDGSPIEVGETRSFEDRPVFVRILDSAEHGRISRTVRKVSDEVLRPVVRARLVERDDSAPLHLASAVNLLRGRCPVRPVDTDPNTAWIFHGEDIEFDSARGPIRVRYDGRAIPLDFAIHLQDFREETYPGTALAASYESHVTVEPEVGKAFSTRIYMNHPLIFGGYTFYQASFQRTSQGEVSVLSVARDPGMKISFVGDCILIAGLVLIFFVKPYFRRLDDRLARSRGTPGEGV